MDSIPYRRWRGALVVAAGLVLALILAVPASAETITIVTEEWPPYNYSEDGVVKGVVTEIVREAMNRTGLEYSIQAMPWSRAYAMAMNTDNVMIYSIFKLPNREASFQWIPLHGPAVTMYLFKPVHREDIQIQDLEDAKHYVVGVTRDTSTHHFLLENGFEENVNLIPLPSEEQNIHMTLPDVERTDLLTGDRLSIAHWLQDSGLTMEYLEEIVFLFQEEFYFAFSRNTSPELVAKVQEAVDEIAADGTMERIMESYAASLNSGAR